MIINDNVTIYQCEYCGKKYFRKYAAVIHEDICLKNPNNYRYCFSCKHLSKKIAECYKEYYGYENYTEFKGFYCNKKKYFLYPPHAKKDLIKLLYYKEEKIENNPMPENCNDYDKY